jgi:hypothetical protein
MNIIYRYIIMNEYIDCSKVYIGKSKHGLGVFTNKDLEVDEVVEVGMITPLVNVDGNENPHLFTWSNDRKVWATGSGLLPFYNHFYVPNVKKIGDLNLNTMKVIAIKPIKKGEEIGNYYHSKEWRKCFQLF